MKAMMKAYQPANGAIAHIVVDANSVDAMNECLKAANAEAKVFYVGKMPLDELPAEVQEEVKNKLQGINAYLSAIKRQNRLQ